MTNKYAIPASKEKRKEIQNMFKCFDEIKIHANESQVSFFNSLLKHYKWCRDLSDKQFEIANLMIENIKPNEK